MINILGIELHIFRFLPIDSRMYVMKIQDELLIIDAVISEEGYQYIENCGAVKATIILTHAHYDHSIGLTEIKKRIPCHVIVAEPGIEILGDSLKNVSAICEVLFLAKPKEEQKLFRALNIQPFIETADESFTDKMQWKWKGHTIELIQTPGHSADSICILLDKQYLFTGDSLVNGNATITRLPGGSTLQFNTTTRPFLMGLNRDLTVLPGHGEISNLGRLLDENEKREKELAEAKQKRMEEVKRKRMEDEVERGGGR